jgi:uncharacterized protein
MANVLIKILRNNNGLFYPQFEEMAMQIVRSADLLTSIIQNPEKAELMHGFTSIREIEVRAGKIVNEVIGTVNTTINTPFDREDIQQMMTAMDDVINHIYYVSQQIRLYRPIAPLHRLHQLNNMIQEGAEQLRIAIFELHSLKHSKEMSKAITKIHELERKADIIYRDLISELFENESDPVELVKHKAIMETMESITDRIDDVSGVLKTILIKSA